MRLSNRLRELRFQKDGMSQQELADLIGVSRMTIYSIEKDRYVPSTVLALKIAKVFDTTVEDVFSLPEDE